MSKTAVLRILGQPSETSCKEEANPSFVLWCYGVDAPGTLATLGQVAFDASGKVIYFTGNSLHLDADYPLPSVNIITEQELRHILRILDNCCKQYEQPEFYSMFFNPLPLIRTANALVSYGKKKVLLAIEEYLWTHNDNLAVSALLLTLFDVPNDKGYLPQSIGEGPGEIPPTPLDKRQVPRFPLVIVDDVPLCVLISAGNSNGITRNRAHLPNLEWFKSRGKWRSKPLTPSKNALGVLERFLSSPEYLSLYSTKTPSGSRIVDPVWAKRVRLDVQRQLLRLVDNIYPYDKKYDHEQGNEIRTLSLADWERMRMEFGSLNAFWDSRQQNYRAADKAQ